MAQYQEQTLRTQQSFTRPPVPGDKEMGDEDQESEMFLSDDQDEKRSYTP